MPPSVLSIAALLLGSGLCALVYQTTWLRELRLIFGASTPASAAVLAIFMGGLGLGGLLLGRRAQRRRSVGVLYASTPLGAFAGASLPPFSLLEEYGTRTTLLLACPLTVGVALLARSLPQGLPPPQDAPEKPSPSPGDEPRPP